MLGVLCLGIVFHLQELCLLLSCLHLADGSRLSDDENFVFCFELMFDLLDRFATCYETLIFNSVK
jgi:hypothetical protein